MKIQITNVNVSDNKLLFKFEYSKSLRKYFLKDSFFVHYYHELDINNVNEGILVIPIVSMIAPVAWAVGADIQVDTLDETYLHSLTKIKQIFRSFYPQFSFHS